MARRVRPTEEEKKRTLIGVLASHDSKDKNEELRDLLEELYRENEKNREKLAKFNFVFTGGTFDRVVLGQRENAAQLDVDTRGFVKENATVLPDFGQGGVTMLANLIVQRQCNIIWHLLSPSTTHWLHAENFALMRLCDVWKVKRLMNFGSVRNWFDNEADMDSNRGRQAMPLKLFSGAEPQSSPSSILATAGDPKGEGYLYIEPASESLKHEEKPSIALIAHDEMKERIIDFAIEYEDQLSTRFSRILTTAATGQQIKNATRRLADLIKLCRSGPEGGDIEIATEILFGRCANVVFFIDPLHPHPHIDDIRTVFGACMRKKEVRIFTNEEHARRWIDHL